MTHCEYTGQTISLGSSCQKKKLKKHMPLLKIFRPEFEHGDKMWRLRTRLKCIFAYGGPFSDSTHSAPAQFLHDI